MDTPSQGSYNGNNSRGQQQLHRPFHPYKNRRNNFQPNNHYGNIRFNGTGVGANEMNPTSFVPQGFSSPIVRHGGAGGEYFHNHRNNRNGGNGNYRNDGLRNRKMFTPFKVGSLGGRAYFVLIEIIEFLYLYVYTETKRRRVRR